MRSKAPLALMEQAVMILVFALAAALCLRVFVWSDRAGKRLTAVDRAVVQVQNMAETLKRTGGERGAGLPAILDAVAERTGAVPSRGEGTALSTLYDKDWEPCPPDGQGAAYALRVEKTESDAPGLASAHVYVEDLSGGELLFEVTVAWQTEVER